ncbi:hypothetical protein ATANTOWER_015937 [Ataeniobius toweri]|uniref:Uncharacterized protein n=1 Tax=Ataeniobius toweri TaxID=208326 RepID=A0ABU7CBR6_9TELE|nr:hypothetical protein [Ataeniobius toweri]
MPTVLKTGGLPPSTKSGTAAQITQTPSHGGTRDPGPNRRTRSEGSGDWLWLPVPRTPSQLHNNCSPATGLLSQRLASQEGKT